MTNIKEFPTLKAAAQSGDPGVAVQVVESEESPDGNRVVLYVGANGIEEASLTFCITRRRETVSIHPLANVVAVALFPHKSDEETP